MGHVAKAAESIGILCLEGVKPGTNADMHRVEIIVGENTVTFVERGVFRQCKAMLFGSRCCHSVRVDDKVKGSEALANAEQFGAVAAVGPLVDVRELRQHATVQMDYHRLVQDLTDVAQAADAGREQLVGLALEGKGRLQKDAAALLMQLTHLYSQAVASGDEVDYLRLNLGRLQEIQSNLERIRAGQKLYELFDGPFLRAYYSQIDGTFQPYSICIPSGYDEGRAFPLIVQFHEYRGFDPFQCISAQCYAGAICVRPEGRRASDYMFLGEEDVLEVIREVCELYNVDRGRIYLTGRAMGGTGSWNLAVHYPDMFAGIMPVAAGADCSALPGRRDWVSDPHEGYGALREFLTSRHSPSSFAENLAHCRVHMVHGTADNVVPVEHARVMADRLRELGYDFQYLEFPQSGHADLPFWAENYALASVFAGPAQRTPARIRFRTADLRHNLAWWLRVDRLLAPDCFSQVRAQLADGEVTIETDNVGALTLLLDRVSASATPDGVRVDGTQMPVPEGMEGRQLSVELCDGRWRVAQPPEGLVKMRGLSGPFSDVFRDAFMVVYGTAEGSGLWAEIARREAERFAWEWELRYGSPCRLSADGEVEEADMRRFNLLLFGGPQVNSISERMADALPVKLTPDAVTVGGRTYEGEDVGVMLCYPNPLNPDKMIALVAGLSPGALYQACDRTGLWFNWGIYDKYKWFDYAVYDSLTNGPETFRVVGFFDNCWRLPSEERQCSLGGGKQWEGLAEHRRRNRPQRFPRMVELPGAETGSVCLSDVLPSRIRQHRGAVGFDRSYEGGMIRLGQRVFEKGLGIKVPSEITYDLQGRYGWFRATVGLTDPPGGGPTPAKVVPEAALFEVRGDGRVLHRSHVLGWQEGQPGYAEVAVNVAAVEELTLKVESVSGVIPPLHGSAAWADPVVEP